MEYWPEKTPETITKKTLLRRLTQKLRRLEAVFSRRSPHIQIMETTQHWIHEVLDEEDEYSPDLIITLLRSQAPEKDHRAILHAIQDLTRSDDFLVMLSPKDIDTIIIRLSNIARRFIGTSKRAEELSFYEKSLVPDLDEELQPLCHQLVRQIRLLHHHRANLINAVDCGPNALRTVQRRTTLAVREIELQSPKDYDESWLQDEAKKAETTRVQIEQEKKAA